MISYHHRESNIPNLDSVLPFQEIKAVEAGRIGANHVGVDLVGGDHIKVRQVEAGVIRERQGGEERVTEK